MAGMTTAAQAPVTAPHDPAPGTPAPPRPHAPPLRPPRHPAPGAPLLRRPRRRIPVVHRRRPRPRASPSTSTPTTWSPTTSAACCSPSNWARPPSRWTRSSSSRRWSSIHLRLPRLRPGRRNPVHGTARRPVDRPRPPRQHGAVLGPRPGQQPFDQTLTVIQNETFPLSWCLLYTVMSLPFLYRSLDAGPRGIHLKTLVEASAASAPDASPPSPGDRAEPARRRRRRRRPWPRSRSAARHRRLGTRPPAVRRWTAEVGDADAELAGRRRACPAPSSPGACCSCSRPLARRQGALARARKSQPPSDSRPLLPPRATPATAAANPASATAADWRHPVLLKGPAPARSATPLHWTASTSTIAPGELVALLGPSGCGKTTGCAYRRASNSPTPASSHRRRGRHRGPAHRRDIGMVFQSYSLFPHLTAAQNVGYGLRVRKRGAAERAAARNRTPGPRRPAPATTTTTRTSSPAASSTRRPRPRARRPAARAAAGRAAVRPRRQGPASPSATRSAASSRARHHHRLRHPRPGRSALHGRPGRRHARGPARTVRHPLRAVRTPRNPLRRRIRRHHEPAARHRPRRGGMVDLFGRRPAGPRHRTGPVNEVDVLLRPRGSLCERGGRGAADGAIAGAVAGAEGTPAT